MKLLSRYAVVVAALMAASLLLAACGGEEEEKAAAPTTATAAATGEATPTKTPTEGEEEQGVEAGPEGFQTYTDTAVGLSVSYPEDWHTYRVSVVDSHLLEIPVAWSPDSVVNCRFRAVVRPAALSVRDYYDQEATLATLAERVLGGRSVEEVGGMLSDEELLLNGLPAVKDRFLVPIEGGQDKVGLVGVTVKVERGASIIEEGEAVFAYLYCETPLSFNKYSDALEQILGSLRPAR